MATATCKAQRSPLAEVIDFGPLLMVHGHIIWSAAGDTYATGGIAMTFDLVPGIEKASPAFPLLVHVHSVNADYGYNFDYATNKLQIFASPPANTEKTAGQALNATVDVVTDDPHYFAIFRKAV